MRSQVLPVEVYADYIKRYTDCPADSGFDLNERSIIDNTNGQGTSLKCPQNEINSAWPLGTNIYKINKTRKQSLVYS